ncbi:MAG: FAD-linked oxidase C-terminal domain-containing protein [Pseudomonadota bacterium]
MALSNTPLPATFISAFCQLLPAAQRLLEPADCWPYGYDNSRRHHLPQAVAFATDTTQVIKLVELCNAHRIPLIPRGRGTGTTGATVPVRGGVVLSLERMNKILSVDPDNRAMVVQPGVTNQQVQEAAAEQGFFWPPDPTSAAFCTVGGNLAYNSAGPRAVKYGTTRDNVLGLSAVTGTGRLIKTGVYTTKGVVGYDLTRLIIGSEGTLAVITEATLKLTPLPECKQTMQAVYHDMRDAARAVSRIMAQPITPCALEFIDGKAIDMIRGYSKSSLPEQAGAMLMIEVDGPAAAMEAAIASVTHAAQGDGLLSFAVARTAEEAAALWATRKALSPALRNIAPKKINEDVVVPVSRMADLIEGLAVLAEQHGITIVNFGHAGNGNIHVNLLVDPEDPAQMRQAEHCLSAVFDLVLKLHGTLSGEHGVGMEKQNFVGWELDAGSLELMRQIKQVFDPNDILNPDKMFPLTPPARS